MAGRLRCADGRSEYLRCRVGERKSKGERQNSGWLRSRDFVFSHPNLQILVSFVQHSFRLAQIWQILDACLRWFSQIAWLRGVLIISVDLI